MGLASGLRNTAEKVINKYGNTISHRVYTDGTYNPATGTQTRTYQDYPICAAVENVGYQQKPDGKDLKVGDKIIHIAAADITVVPEEKSQDHFIIIGSNTWNIISVKNEVAQDITMLYTLTVRM